MQALFLDEAAREQQEPGFRWNTQSSAKQRPRTVIKRMEDRAIHPVRYPQRHATKVHEALEVSQHRVADKDALRCSAEQQLPQQAIRSRKGRPQQRVAERDVAD